MGSMMSFLKGRAEGKRKLSFKPLHDEFNGPRFWPVFREPGHEHILGQFIDLVNRVGSRHFGDPGERSGLALASRDQAVTDDFLKLT